MLKMIIGGNSHDVDNQNPHSNMQQCITRDFSNFRALYCYAGTPPTAAEFENWVYNHAIYGDANNPFLAQYCGRIYFSGLWTYDLVDSNDPNQTGWARMAERRESDYFHRSVSDITWAVLSYSTTTSYYNTAFGGSNATGNSNHAVMFETDEIATPQTATPNTKIILESVSSITSQSDLVLRQIFIPFYAAFPKFVMA